MGCQSAYDSIGSREGGESERDSDSESGERVVETGRGIRAAAEEAGEIVDVDDAVAIRGLRWVGKSDMTILQANNTTNK